MIRVNSTIADGSRHARGSAWLAQCSIDGQTFDPRSRHGAPNALARQLVDAGFPDDAMEIFDTRSNRVTLTYRSFHQAAKSTYEESALRPLRRVKWRSLPEGLSLGGGDAKNDREEPATEQKPRARLRALKSRYLHHES